MKKKITVAAAGIAMALAVTACSSTPSEPTGGSAAPAADVTLTFMTNVVGAQADALGEVLNNFTTDTGIKVEYSAPGSEYENLMKTKMAANELPDLFTTHGWSVKRYSDYLAPVNDQPFFSKITDQMKPVISDADGNVYVLPIDADIAGIVYNVDVLKKANVDVDSLRTWDDFTAALEQIKQSAPGSQGRHLRRRDMEPGLRAHGNLDQGWLLQHGRPHLRLRRRRRSNGQRRRRVRLLRELLHRGLAEDQP